MQVDLGISRLLFAASGQVTAGFRSNAGDPAHIAKLANRYASEKLGLAPGRAPGAYMPVYKTTERFVDEAVLETRDTVRTDDVFEERSIIETRDVYETRAVYEERAILETTVAGDRRLTRYDSLTEAGIERRSAFALTVGDGATAVVKFESSSRISVTAGGATEQFSFNSWDGSFRDGLRDALNSIEGLSATYSNGKLLLETSGGQSLTIADVAGGGWNAPDSPLDRLGLEEGVTVGEVVGYETVQTGTEQVVVGSEQVTVGVEQVKVGEQSAVTGNETVLTGTVSRLDGYDHELIGLEEPEIYETGVLGLLGQIGPGALPPNYVEALFGRVDVEEEGSAARGSEADVRAAYDETDRLAASDEEPADSQDAAAHFQPPAARSGADTQSI